MTALAAARVVLVPTGTIKKITVPLGAGVKAWQNGMCAIDSARVGFVWPATTGVATLKNVGRFLDNADATSASVAVGIELNKEKDIQYWDSVTGAGAITVANLFQDVYIASDHELTTVAGSNSIAGKVWTIGPSGYPGAVGIEAAP